MYARKISNILQNMSYGIDAMARLEVQVPVIELMKGPVPVDPESYQDVLFNAGCSNLNCFD